VLVPERSSHGNNMGTWRNIAKPDHGFLSRWNVEGSMRR
jgi:hypothetical protein